MGKKILRTIGLSLVAALPCLALAVLIGNLTGLWVFESWSEILFTYMGVSVIIIFADLISQPFFKNKTERI